MPPTTRSNAMRYVLCSCMFLFLLASTACDVFDKKEDKLPGERITILSDIGKLSPSTSLDGVAVELPDPTAPASWPQAGGNIRHYTGHILLPGNLSGEFTTDAGEGADWPSSLIAAPIASENMVFSMDASGTVAARSLKSPSTLVWQAPLGNDETDAIGGGLAYESDRVFVTQASGKVVGLDANTGKTLWTRSLKTPLRSAPATVPGMVLVITVDSQLFALEAATGEIVWRHRGIQETASLLGTVIPAADSGRVVVAYSSGEIYALSLHDGEVLWTDVLILPRRTTALGSFTGVGGNPVIAGNIVYTVSLNGLLAANDLTSGLRIWEQPVASHSTPWVSGDFLFIVTTSRQILCIYRSDGRIKWVSDLPPGEEAETLSGPYIINKLVVVPASSGKYYALNPFTGELQGTRDFVSGALSPAAFAGGMMWIADQNATLHAFQ